MADAMTYETYLRQQADKSQYGVTVIQTQIALDIAHWIERKRNDEPYIDAVPVIRCKDCKHRYIKNDVWTCPFGLMSGPDGYCSWAERKES